MVNVNSLAVLAATLVGAVNANSDNEGQWVLGMFRPLVQMRADPIIDPGKVGGHVHTVLGASNFYSQLSSPNEMLEAECTTTALQADKSNYWAPSLYFINPEGKYEAIPNNNRVYYKLHGDNVQPFPPGMRMLTGRGTNRNQWDPAARAPMLDCDHRRLGNWLPNATNTQNLCTAIHLGIDFPSCGWANQSLDSDDHWSHLTWPIGVGGGNVWQVKHGFQCPESHPIKYPHIFLEANFYPTDSQKKRWRQGKSDSLILSNGDTTGLAFHADFVNGWDQNVLSQALDKCHQRIGDNLAACFVFKPHIDVAKAINCRFQGMIPDEQVGWYEPLEQLPGCNPRWDYSMGEKKPTDCPWYKGDPKWIAPKVLVGDESTESGIPMNENLLDGQAPVPNVGENPYATPWGTDGTQRNAKFPAPNFIMTSANQPSSQSLVAGMLDATPFTEVKGPANVVPESKWSVPAYVPKVDTVWLPYEYIGSERPDDVDNPDIYGSESESSASGAPTVNVLIAPKPSASPAPSQSADDTTLESAFSSSAPVVDPSPAAEPSPSSSSGLESAAVSDSASSSSTDAAAPAATTTAPTRKCKAKGHKRRARRSRLH